MRKFLEAIRIGYMILSALASFVAGEPASIFFTYKGEAYKLTLEEVK
jgi:hypothetical protein